MLPRGLNHTTHQEEDTHFPGAGQTAKVHSELLVKGSSMVEAGASVMGSRAREGPMPL